MPVLSTPCLIGKEFQPAQAERTSGRRPGIPARHGRYFSRRRNFYSLSGKYARPSLSSSSGVAANLYEPSITLTNRGSSPINDQDCLEMDEMLSSIFWGMRYDESATFIPIILIVMTCLDGHQMDNRERAHLALAIAVETFRRVSRWRNAGFRCSTAIPSSSSGSHRSSGRARPGRRR